MSDEFPCDGGENAPALRRAPRCLSVKPLAMIWRRRDRHIQLANIILGIEFATESRASGAESSTAA